MCSSCSSDSTSDAATSTPDAAASVIDARPPADAGLPKVFTVTLTKAGELPPCTNAGANATGSATVTISADGTTITVTDFTFTGLSAAASGAHIHFGTATSPSGPISLDFGANPTSPIASKVFTATDYKNAGTGTPTSPATFADFVTMVRAGNNAYLNVHTPGATGCPGGEIRGELQ
jgi:hypothetical protein